MKINKNLPKSGQESGQESGFTLIELSIVLVIIGLIIGGVLVGQNLIKSATLRATMGQYETMNTAFNTFRGKYNGLPGDTNRATTFFTYTSVVNGDGNGLILDGTGTLTNFAAATSEIGQVFPMLSAAGLLGGTFQAATGTPAAITVGTHFPASKHGRGGYFVAAVNGTNQFILGANSSTAVVLGGATGVLQRTLTPEEAFIIDDKTDDGAPNTGITRAVEYTSPNIVADTDVAAPRCITAITSAGIYAVTDNPSAPNCTLQMQMN
jgi:prepilin-type N-terminal cleavage/methylation domain-containing protein